MIRVRFGDQIIKQRSFFMRSELEPVIMISEGESILTQNSSNPVEIFNRSVSILYSKGRLMRYGTDSHIAGTECLSLLNNALRFVHQCIVAHSVGGADQPALVKHFT